MGKASKLLKALKRWSFGKEKGRRKSQNDVVEEEAGGGITRAAVVIQSHFRAYLPRTLEARFLDTQITRLGSSTQSRRALQALRAVVMLQALVRGQLSRKYYYVNKLKTTRRPLISTAKSSPLNHMGQARQERLNYTAVAKQEQLLMHKKRRRWRSNSNVEKIPEVEAKHKVLFHSPQLSQSSDQYYQSYEQYFSTAENSPQYLYAAASSMGARAPFTPTKTRSYMAYTQSSMAKVRSRNRPQNEKRSSVFELV